ncbi:hypothetical protein [Bacillus sp. AK128]
MRRCGIIGGAVLVVGFLIYFGLRGGGSEFSEAVLEERADLSLDWLRGQQDSLVYPVGVEFLEDYHDEYTGSVEGTVDLRALEQYENGLGVDGLSDYEVWIYSVSEVDKVSSPPVLELYEKLSIDVDGTFKTESSVQGKKLARLVRKLDEVVLGTTEVHKYQLIRSYSVPADDPLSKLAIHRRSWLYDNALAVISFSLAGDQERASNILSSLAELQNEDGSFAFAYDVYIGPIDETKRSGSIAWLGDSILKYETAFGDSQFRPVAESIAQYLLSQQDHQTGSIKGGPDVDWYSTEHNIDAYFFFRDFGMLTGDDTYNEISDAIRQALLTDHWNTEEGRFNQGIHDQAEALDANSWGAIFLLAVGEEELAKSAVSYLSKFEVQNATMIKSDAESTYNMAYQTKAPLVGYKPYGKGYEEPPDIVWTEGTWGVINLFLRQEKDVDHLLASMFAMQDTDPAGGLVYSHSRQSEEPYLFYVWPAVASTAWQYITLKNPRAIWDDTVVE